LGNKRAPPVVHLVTKEPDMNHCVRFAAIVLAFSLAAQVEAQSYMVDPVHSSAVFRIKHANASPFWGLFRAPTGSFTLAADKSSFKIEIPVANVYTGNDKRDAHLKSPDFFNARQYPTITFTSKSVKQSGEMLEASGDLTLHGVTKPVTVTIEQTGTGELRPGEKRAGIEATLVVKMSDFEMKGMPGALSDEVKVIVGLAGVQQ
jgi:polyisoprenoid-binding protein YceI